MDDLRKKVCCRPYGVAAFLGVLSFYPLMLGLIATRPSPKAGPHAFEIVVGLASALLFAILCGLIWVVCSKVIADEKGLSWCTLWKRYRVPWNEVTDYYLEIPQVKPITIIETTQGRLRLTQAFWSHLPALREFVQQHATSASGAEWGVHGVRPCDPLPRVFRYPRGTRYGYTAMFYSYTVLLLGVGAWPIYRALTTPYFGSWLMRVGAVVTISLVFLSMIVMFWTLLGSVARETRDRYRDRVIVELSGIAFERDDERRFVPWETVTDYYYERPVMDGGLAQRYVIETEQGNFDFSHSIDARGELKAAIARYAVNAASREWIVREDSDTLGDARSRWTGGLEGRGARIYGYRTRTNRAVLWFLWVFAAMPLLSFYLFHLVAPDESRNMSNLVVAAWLSLPALWAAWRYRSAAVHTDEDGIALIGLAGRRYIAWKDIVAYRLVANKALAEVRSPDKTIRVWSNIADFDVLQDEIAEKAVNSRERGWEVTGAKARRSRQ